MANNNKFNIKHGFVSNDDSIVNGTLSATTFNITATPTLENLPTQVLVRNPISGEIEYALSSNVGNTGDTYVTGFTINSNQLELTQNDGTSGFTVDLSPYLDNTDNYVTGGTMVGNTLVLNRTDQLSAATVDLSSFLDDTNFYVTGFTYNNNNTITLSRNGGLSDLNVTVNQMSGLTITGQLSVGQDITLYSEDGTTDPTFTYSGTSGGTIQLVVQPDGKLDWVGNDGLLFSIEDDLTGLLFSVNDISGLPVMEVYASDRVILGKFDENALVVDTDQVFIGTDTVSTTSKLYVSGNTTITDTLVLPNGAVNGYILSTDGSGNSSWTNLSSLSISTGDTYTTGFTYSSTNNTLTISDNVGGTFVAGITTMSGLTITNDLTVGGDLTVNGTTTTINTDELHVEDNIIRLNSNVTGGTPTLDSGLESLRGSATTANLIWDESDGQWEAGLQGSTQKIILSGDSLSLLNSGHTHPISEINNLQTELNSKTDLTLFNSHTGDTSIHFTVGSLDPRFVNVTGDTMTGNLTINSNLTVTGTTSVGTNITLFSQDGTTDPSITYSGTTGGTITLQVQPDGSLVWEGDNGSLFSIVDDKDGILWAVSDISGNDIGYIDADWLVQFGNPFKRPFKIVYDSGSGNSDITMDADVIIETGNTLTYKPGATNGYILTSDANGNSTWSDPTSVGTTDNYVTGGTMVGNTLVLNRTDQLSGATIDLSQFLDDTTVSITGFTYTPTNNLLTITDDNGGTFTAGITEMSGLTINSVSSADALKISTTGHSDTLTVYSDGTVGVKVTGSTSYDLEVNGSFGAESKSFVIPHPTKEGKKLHHGSLEGPEFGVYVRGKIEGKVIELPEYWTGLVNEETITVQLTPIGAWQRIYVEGIEGNRVYINTESNYTPYCYYTIYGERKDIDKLEVEQ